MKQEEIDRLYIDAIEFWGDKAQVLMFIEECGEAVQAACKSFRHSKPDTWREDLADEVADVLIMAEQMKFVLPEGMVEERIQFKRDRLRKRLDTYKPKEQSS